MLSNIPANLILAGLIALIALPFVVVACSVYVADRLVRALHAIYRLQKEQGAAAQRSAEALAGALSTSPVPAVALAPPEMRMQSEKTAASGRVPAPTVASPAPAEVAKPGTPPGARLEVREENAAEVHPAASPVPVPASAVNSIPDAPPDPHATEHSEAELEALRSRVRQMTLGGG